MELLRSISPLVEPLSLDEAFVDLEAADLPDLSVTAVSALARELKERVHEVTGGLTGSVGIGTSKLVAKIASDLDKPDGLVVVAPGMEQDLLRPMQVTVIPGVGPATAERLRRVGVHTVEELERLTGDELVRLLGRAHGAGLYALARARGRPGGGAGAGDQVDQRRGHLRDRPRRQAAARGPARPAGRKVTERLRKARISGRTVSIKVRLHDFSTVSRSATLPEPSDDVVRSPGWRDGCSPSWTPPSGVRLLGVGVSGLADWIQEDLFADDEDEEVVRRRGRPRPHVAAARRNRAWAPGMDVVHDEHGRGWVWGSGRGVVTVRFETAETGPGRVAQLLEHRPAARAVQTTRRVISSPGRSCAHVARSSGTTTPTTG